MRKAVVITHAGCPDGHCSAFLLDKYIRNNITNIVEHHPVGYDNPMFTGDADLGWLDGAAVYIADFCPPADWLLRAANHASSILVLDHHETAAKSIVPRLAGLADDQPFQIHDSIGDWENGPGSKFEIVVDMNHSGAGLVAQWLGVHGVEAHGIFPHWREIEDRDLWRYSIDGSEEICAAIAAKPLTFEAWEELAGTGRGVLLERGGPVVTYKRQLVDSITAKPFGLYLGEAGGLVVPCCNPPYMIGSDAAGKLAENSRDGLGAYIVVHGDDVQVGLRSRGGGPNCREIAELYGGGGHPGAAGFRLTHQDLVSRISRSVDPAIVAVGG